jgi:acetylornithine deacetylase
MQSHTIRIPKNSTVNVLRRLVRINSVNPDVGEGPGEAKIAEEIAGMLESAGLEVEMQKVLGDRYNVIGILRGEGGGESLMLTGHMDTVGVRNMEIAPFDPKIKDGYLYGRGACDMKGGLASMISAAKALARSDVKLRGDLYVSGVVDEEYLSIGTEKLAEKYKTDGVIVGEPTRMRVGVAHMGYLWIEVETWGRSAHGSVPEMGHDAIVDMARIIEQLETMKIELKKKHHPLLGSPKIHTSTVTGGQAWSIVPDYCHLRLERRTLPGEKGRAGMEEIRGAIKSVISKYPRVRANAKLKLERAPFQVKKTTRLANCVAQASNKAARASRFVGLTYWSDASIFFDKGMVETCLFGPGDINLAHSPLEYISVAEVEKSVRVYAQTALSFCGTRHE